MMAVYTIYSPSTRSCPVAFTAGEFWQHPENFSVAVKNTSSKPIANMSIISEMFLAPQDLRRPYNFDWSSKEAIAPGEERNLQKPGIRASSAQSVLGWVFFPYSVTYADGSIWRSQSEGECFHVFWRDKQHPDMPALPPRQQEMNAD